jgi:oligoendopeptidase F
MLMATGLMSVEEVALTMGIDITKQEFWIESLKFIEEEIDLFESLLKELKLV